MTNEELVELKDLTFVSAIYNEYRLHWKPILTALLSMRIESWYSIVNAVYWVRLCIDIRSTDYCTAVLKSQSLKLNGQCVRFNVRFNI